MAGIYIHIPFCKTRCIYCDFFTKTNMDQKDLYIESLCKELEFRADYLESELIETIYFGGGTPSQLEKDDFTSIFKSINSKFTIDRNAEITLEANPDDLSVTYLEMLHEIGINRLSMGVQSFDDNQLRFLKRRHTASKAIDAIKISQQIGFENVSIDLMYGLPKLDLPTWERSIEIAIELGVQHISSYHLIYEEGTKLYQLHQKGDIKSIDEELSLEMFSTMIERLNQAGFIHYEISNFGKENFFSRHNSSYWKGKKYLGVGPSAHSFNGNNRSWNISSISQYIEGVEKNNLCLKTEALDKKERYNEFILTGMRTMWGIDTIVLESLFGKDLLLYCIKNINKYVTSGDVIINNTNYRISRKGIFISDLIMSDLMYIG